MTAVPIMDANMDTGMQIHRNTDRNVLKVFEEMEMNLIVKNWICILDRLLALQMEWLSGQYLGYTVFCFVPFHRMDGFETADNRLVPFKQILLSFLRQTLLCRSVVMERCCFFDEDFLQDTAGCPFMPDLSIAEYSTSVTWLDAFVTSGDSRSCFPGSDQSLLQHLLARFTFIQVRNILCFNESQI